MRLVYQLIELGAQHAVLSPFWSQACAAAELLPHLVLAWLMATALPGGPSSSARHFPG